MPILGEQSFFAICFHQNTLGGIASICFRFHFQQTLRMHPQGCQGCHKIRNFVRNSKMLIARSTIQPKLNKIKIHLPFFDEFWCIFTVFLILLNLGWMVDLAMSIFVFLTKFLIFWHPWHLWVCIRSDLNHCLKQIFAIPPTVQPGTNQLYESWKGAQSLLS